MNRHAPTKVVQLILLLACTAATAQNIPAFPGADGAGAYAEGGRGGIVYHVTKLESAIDDPARFDFGTLRYGLDSSNFPAGVPRTIVFDVGGVFNLGRLPQTGWDPNGNGWDAQSRLTIGGSNVTLAGQTAPGAGVIFMGGGLKPQGNNNILRNITVAAGYGTRGWWKPGEAFPDEPAPQPASGGPGIFPDATVYDALDISGTNLIIDHVSTLYATDETISMNEVADNITVQFSNISQGQNYPQWDAEGGGFTGHALGSLLEAGTDSSISFHHNLYAHQKSRVPQTQGDAAYYDFRNNVFYNWLGTAGSIRSPTRANLVGNFYLAGNGGDDPNGGNNTGVSHENGGTSVTGVNSRTHRQGDLLDANKDGDAEDGVLLPQGNPFSGGAPPQWANGVATYHGTTDTAEQAYDRVLDYVGANWWTRDDVIDTPDERIIHETRTGTGKIVAWANNPWDNSPSEGAEWRGLKNTPQVNRTASWDTESDNGYGQGDGMPTYWELQHGLDPDSHDDAGDFDNDGYTNLEEYLNEIAAWPAANAIAFNNANGDGRFAHILNWDANPDTGAVHPWQPLKFDTAIINNAAVVVDSVGQHAGNLLLGTGPGNNGTLNITAGWLVVEDAPHGMSDGATVIGDDSSATATLNLSGGKLVTQSLLKGPASSFHFTGGTLAAEVIDFDLTNNGGILSPGAVVVGQSPGVTQIAGDLTITAGSLVIELGATDYDRLTVAGDVTLGGTLDVSLLEGVALDSGMVFEIVEVGESLAGQFANLDEGSLVGNFGKNLFITYQAGDGNDVALFTAPSLPGDFDGNGTVDSADYNLWRDNLGGDSAPLNGNGDETGGSAGVVDAADYLVWKNNFGSAVPASAKATASVPEPASFDLLLLVALAAQFKQLISTTQKCVKHATIAACLLLLCLAPSAWGQIKAFPQAEGFGAISTGGRGGDVYHVTNLNNSGAGSLRHGIENAPSAGRTIVFDVGGWIDIHSKLGITRDNITIAGQTAPGGIGVRGHQLSIGGDDIVIRHVRFRPGEHSGSEGSIDAISANNEAERIIYDHVSAQFSTDGGFDSQATDLTLQYSTISWGLLNHSTGSLLENPHRMTIHHNLYAHNNTRNPKHRVQETLDFVNNVIYNWDTRAFQMQGTNSTGFFWTSNVDGNYFIAGPNQDNTKPISGGSLDDYGTWFGTNAYDSDRDSSHDGVTYTSHNDPNFSNISSALSTWSNVPYPVADEVWKDASPDAAYQRVLAEFGATPWNRDEVDQLLHSDVMNRTGSFIDQEDQLVSRGVGNSGFATLGGGVAPTDSDLDGIPNDWEIKHGTNPFAANNNGDFDHDGYTDLEEYLNDLAAFAAAGPLEFRGIGRYADSGRWTENWEPSRVDDVRVNDGAAFVDAVGQKAGSLQLGGTANGNGRLYLTSGWLEVTHSLTVGGSGVDTGVGTVEHHGGELRVLQAGVDIDNGSYQLRGGSLITPKLEKESTGQFEFTGGVLSATSITFGLEINGGELATAVDEVGFTAVQGDLTVNSGAISIDLHNSTIADQIFVTGDVVLGGDLTIVALGSFVPTPAQSWDILFGNSISGDFDSITPGFRVENLGTSLRLVADGITGSLNVPEPSAALLGLAATGLVIGFRLRRVWLGYLLALFCTLTFASANAATLAVVADTQLSENGTTGAGDATATGGGASTAINARWNYISSPANRNEWIALKFNLSDHSEKMRLQDVTLRTYMHRSNANNSQTLRLYALTPGVAGEDWDEANVTYATMPGFTFDADSSTNLLDAGGALQDLGVFSVSGVEFEGNLSSINPNSLTDLVRSMGDHNLLTLLISYETPSNGQWRVMSREATTSDTGILSGTAGQFAAFLDFELDTSSVDGDYNDQSIVDLADYTVWRDQLGGTSLLNEEVSPNVVDNADFLYWRERFGATNPGNLQAAFEAANVPEPSTLWLLAGLSAVLIGRRVR